MIFTPKIWQHARFFASKPRPTSKKLGAALSLDHFLIRQKVLALWKQICRDTRRISDPATKKEVRQDAKYEFERNKGVEDLGHIRYLISTGKTQWESMQRYMQ